MGCRAQGGGRCSRSPLENVAIAWGIGAVVALVIILVLIFTGCDSVELTAGAPSSVRGVDVQGGPDAGAPTADQVLEFVRRAEEGFARLSDAGAEGGDR